MQETSTKAIAGLLGAFVLALLPLGAAGAGALHLQKSIPYEKGVQVSNAVRTECTIDVKIPAYLEAAAAKQFSPIDNAAGGPGKTLTMKITGVDGAGGGAWSGPKSISLEGALKENGKVIGTFRASRYSGGGAFGGYKGTCSILDRCAKALAKDISGWLAAPSMEARLGDAR